VRIARVDLLLPGALAAAFVFTMVLWSGSGPANTPSVRDALAVLAVLEAAALVLASNWFLHRKPRAFHQTRYLVSDRRVIVTEGGRARRSRSVFLDQLAEPVLIKRRDGTADLLVRDLLPPRQWTDLVIRRWDNQRRLTPVDWQPFPCLCGLADGEVVRQQVSMARQQMLGGMLEFPPAGPLPAGFRAAPEVLATVDFMPEPGEWILWTGHSVDVAWWFGSSDVFFSLYFAFFMVATSAWCVWAVSQKAPALLMGCVGVFAAALVGYPAVGRLLVRRARIRRSTCILTSSRLIATWGVDARSGAQAFLAQLLPPEVHGTSIFMTLAWPNPRPGAPGQMLWPATAASPPQLIGVPDAHAVAQLICAAQLAERARTWAAWRRLAPPGRPGPGT
jgi:hypothetical protein